MATTQRAPGVGRSISVRVDARTYAQVRKLAAQSDRSITQVIAHAVEQAAEQAFWRAFHEAHQRLKSDPDAWAAYQAEGRDWDGTLMDGLDPDEDWTWLKQASDKGDVEFVDEPGTDQ